MKKHYFQMNKEVWVTKNFRFSTIHVYWVTSDPKLYWSYLFLYKSKGDQVFGEDAPYQNPRNISDHPQKLCLKWGRSISSSNLTYIYRSISKEPCILKHGTGNFHTCIVTKFECPNLLKSNTKKTFKSFPTDRLKWHLWFYQIEMFHSGNHTG